MINHECANGSLARAGAGRNLKSSIERRAGGSPLAGHIWREAEGVAANASPPLAFHVCVRVCVFLSYSLRLLPQAQVSQYGKTNLSRDGLNTARVI